MQKFTNFLEEKLVPLANIVATNKALSAISTGFSIIMPILIIGAIFSLLSGLQLGPYQAFIQSTGLAEAFAIPPKVTTDLLAIYVVFAVAYAYCSNNNLQKEAYIGGFLALMAFFIITPTTVVGEGFAAVKMLPFSWLGSAGLFMAIIVGLLTASIYIFVVKRNWVIKLPDGVPPTIAKSFSALVPGFIVAVVFLIINSFFLKVMGTDPNTFLYGIISAPLSALSGSLWTYLLLSFLSCLFWFFGLHGGMITMPFSIMLFTQAGVANQTAYLAGDPLPYIFTSTSIYVTLLGGIGATLSLCILMVFKSKSARFKTLGKLSIMPGICGINEPVMFGFPIILNPILALPFFAIPLVNGIIMYLTMSFGLVSAPRIATGAFGTPVFLDAFLVVGGAGIILQIFLIALDMLIYYPFFKIQDNIAYQEELGAIE